MKTDPTFWILARSSGLTAYALLTASVLLGLLVKARPFGQAIRPATATELHRFVSFMALGAIGVHGIALLLDKAVPISVQALLVPGLAPYRPLWTGLGVVAAELAAIIVASFSLRRFIGRRNWRRLHWATYGTFALATAHGLLAGSDSSRPWAVALYAGALGSVIAATAWRALVPPARPTPQARPSSPPLPTHGGTSDEHLPHRDRPVAV